MKVIMISGVDVAAQDVVLENGADAFLKKTFSKAEFHQTVKALLNEEATLIKNYRRRPGQQKVYVGNSGVNSLELVPLGVRRNKQGLLAAFNGIIALRHKDNWRILE